MLNKIVEVKHLSHKYSVDWAIRDINFCDKGEWRVWVIGSNGAGKSTTMNIICNVLTQTEGDVFINGINLRERPIEAKKFIGFLPQKALSPHGDDGRRIFISLCGYPVDA